MAQHFLLSKAARTLSLSAVARMSDEEARAAFQAVRWAGNGGEPYCPKCSCLKVSAYDPLFEAAGTPHGGATLVLPAKPLVGWQKD